MASIKYKLSSKIGENGKSEIFIFVTISRTKRFQVKSGVFVKPQHFAATGIQSGLQVGEIKIPHKSKLNFADVQEASEEAARLQDTTNRVLRLCEILPHEEINKSRIESVLPVVAALPVASITAATIQEEEQKPQEQTTQSEYTFYELAEMYLNEKQVSDSRKHAFAVFLRAVHRFEGYTKATTNKAFTFDLPVISLHDVEALRAYLRNEYSLSQAHKELFDTLLCDYPVECSLKHTKQIIHEHGENSIIKFMKMLRAVCKWAHVKGYTPNDPTQALFIGSEVYGTPFYLSVAERNLLAEFDLSSRPYLAIQRDIFIFHCLVGCRVGDLYRLTADNIQNGILEYVPHKTKDEAQQVKPRVPLTDTAKRLIETYRGKDSKGRLFPFVSEQKYNEAIKEMLLLCGIDRKVIVRNATTGENEIKPLYAVASSHMARRTFVGGLYAKVADPNLIGRMSGHVEGSRAFARYRNITDDILQNVIKGIE